MNDRFISEPIIPIKSSMQTARMSAGEPGLPGEFIWKEKKISVKKVLRHWKETGPCRHGSKDVYLRKHWYVIETDSCVLMKIYFRKPTKGNRREAGWWLFSLEEH